MWGLRRLFSLSNCFKCESETHNYNTAKLTREKWRRCLWVCVCVMMFCWSQNSPFFVICKMSRYIVYTCQYIVWIRQQVSRWERRGRGRKREIAMLCSAAQTNILWRKLLYHENWKTFFSLSVSLAHSHVSLTHIQKKALPCAQYSHSACHRHFGATFFSLHHFHCLPHFPHTHKYTLPSSSCFICPCCYCGCCRRFFVLLIWSF